MTAEELNKPMELKEKSGTIAKRGPPELEAPGGTWPCEFSRISDPVNSGKCESRKIATRIDSSNLNRFKIKSF